eukprot:CAMPEP_0119317090 /NCGR_PEP_ID=MMETSP1333-20130426/41958_1 /TAXON_ID=418940 /ORGANISM="Scyphosphaera apsteinii, Strain RCC1455" /LENGTH=370 /DNA_ID=CAMNT_0007322929 /DNA_START=14 /DNA_END=1126 /DNA_ORIENTATION=-
MSGQPSKPSGPLTQEEKELDFANYFHSYGYLYHQKDMLQDRGRMDAYRNAILENRVRFKDKVVLDVGTGSGVLAIWAAMAGAKRVYAVEATTMAKNARRLARANGFQEVIIVLEGYMEQLSLPEQVDIILSEWMGYFLLRESMLDSVIASRVKYLKPGGALYPSHAQLHMAPLCTQLYHARHAEYVEELAHWQTFGQYMRSTNSIEIDVLDETWRQEQFEYLMQTSHWCQLSPEEVIGESFTCLTLDVHDCTVDQVSSFRSNFRSRILAAAELTALGGWFDVQFCGSEQEPAAVDVELTTAPPSDTHWGQQVFFVSPPQHLLPGDVLEGHVAMTRQRANHRLLWLQITFTITRPSVGEIYPERTLNFRID